AMAMQLAPDQPQAHNALGLAQFLAGEDDAALASFHQAHELDQAYADPLFNAAEIHRRRLEFPRAASLFHAVVERAPDHVIAKGHLGFLYLRMGDIDRARSWLGTVIDDMPMEAYANAQMATLELVAGNTAAAIGICERVYRVFPAHRRCLHILGGANLKLGNHDAAMQWFRVLGSTFAGNQYALLGEAQVLIANGELRQGEALVEEVLLQATAAAQSPEASWSDYWTMAACLALKGEADQAFEWLEKAAAAGRRFHLWDARDDMFAPLRSDERFAKYVALTESLSNRGT
ncbi:MAG: tetratricopeptide repeat protein, partial [Pseudomonadota bacterium]